MKYLAFTLAVLFYITPAQAELMVVKLTIIKEGSGSKYVTIEGDERSSHGVWDVNIIIQAFFKYVDSSTHQV